MAFKERREIADRDTLELLIEGKTYIVEDVTAKVGLTVQRLLELGQAAQAGQQVDGSELSDGEERDLYRKVLQSTLEEMSEDGLDWQDIKAAAMTTIAWIALGKKKAEEVWDNDGELPQGEAEGPTNRASRRAAAKAATSTKTASRSTSKVSPRKSPKRAKLPGQRCSISGRWSHRTCCLSTALTPNPRRCAAARGGGCDTRSSACSPASPASTGTSTRPRNSRNRAYRGVDERVGVTHGPQPG